MWGIFFLLMAGYSGTLLVKKLGLKQAMTMYVYQPPEHYFDWLIPIPEDIQIRQRLSGKLDFIHLFVKEKITFRSLFKKARMVLKDNGMMWISWPKKSSGVASDLDENIIRDIGLKEGLVDVKVCAVNEIWSGLKFVFRVKDRT